MKVGQIRRTVLWVCPVPEIGGVGRHLLDVARHPLPGWDLIFAVPEGQLADRLRAARATVVALEIGPSVNPVRAALRLRRLIRRTRPAVVHSHLPRADLLAAVATLALPITLISTEHGGVKWSV